MLKTKGIRNRIRVHVTRWERGHPQIKPGAGLAALCGRDARAPRREPYVDIHDKEQVRNRWWILGTGLLLVLLTVSSGLCFLAGPAVEDGTLEVTDPGEYVVPGTPIVVLVDLKALHLKTYVKETDIGKVKLGDPGRVLVDAFPGRPFRARVSEISPEAEFTPKSVDIKEERVKLVFGVKLAVENSEGYLKPGMPADGQILWKPGASGGD